MAEKISSFPFQLEEFAPVDRIHVENKNEHGRVFRESSIHNNIMHDCNRHRPNGYKDSTWVNRIPDEHIEEFHRRRQNDIDRYQNIVNKRFPSLADARDQYLNAEKRGTIGADTSEEFTHDEPSFAELEDEVNDVTIDPQNLTRAQKARLYANHDSPRHRANKFITNQLGNLSLYPLASSQAQDEKGSIFAASNPNQKSGKLSNSMTNKMSAAVSQYGKQTLTSSIKTRTITKGNFKQGPIHNKKFIPVNKAQAKETIFRTVSHDHEIQNFINKDLNQSAGPQTIGQVSTLEPMPSVIKQKRSQTNRNDLSQHKQEDSLMTSPQGSAGKGSPTAGFVNALNDPFFASRLDKLDSKNSKMSLKQKMYDNTSTLGGSTGQNLYDYQKIQSTQHGSQFLGQRHFLLGGPTSGHYQNIRRIMHKDAEFCRSSPSPQKTFDECRGASPTINSYNGLKQFMPGQEESSRLTVLQNFKEINRIMTSNFLKNKQLESKYKKRIPLDVLQKKEIEDQATSTMTTIMKKMHSPREFVSPLRKIGSVQTYQNVNLNIVKNSLLEKERSAKSQYQSKKLNVTSVLNTSSQFDKNASTLDGTQMSIQHQFEMKTDVDPHEQQHNCMNLVLGKPTQQFKPAFKNQFKKGARALNEAGISMATTNQKKMNHTRQSTINQDSIISVNSAPDNQLNMVTPDAQAVNQKQ